MNVEVIGSKGDNPQEFPKLIIDPNGNPVIIGRLFNTKTKKDEYVGISLFTGQAHRLNNYENYQTYQKGTVIKTTI